MSTTWVDRCTDHVADHQSPSETSLAVTQFGKMPLQQPREIGRCMSSPPLVQLLCELRTSCDRRVGVSKWHLSASALRDVTCPQRCRSTIAGRSPDPYHAQEHVTRALCARSGIQTSTTFAKNYRPERDTAHHAVNENLAARSTTLHISWWEQLVALADSLRTASPSCTRARNQIWDARQPVNFRTFTVNANFTVRRTFLFHTL